jgi:hypothetical protein
MLVSSLPPLPVRYDCERLPIGKERLQARLRMLEPEDAQEMERVFQILSWSRQFEEPNDAAVVKRYEELMREISHPLIRDLLETLMDGRMILTALRLRRRGLGSPSVGIGRRADQIRRNFNRPDFGLGHVFPQIISFDQMLEEGDLEGLHRGLMGGIWNDLRKRAENYYFSFEAILFYVARWDLIRQWQELQPDRGRVIFEGLVTEVLGDYANIYS